MGNSVEPWWQTGIIYQIFFRSFMDSNGDGVGDLNGIIQKLDYLNDGTENSLCVNAIWLSPIFPSPGHDMGYDVSNYHEIDPLFGTLDDFARLIDEAHRRGIRVILDLVPNHTSNQHPWFIESCSSIDNPKRDWYIWRSKANNWLSMFGGPAWEIHHATQQYYLHTFLKEQPELNWRNPEVRKAMHKEMKFWFDLGVDGFRVDVIYALAKDPHFTNDPLNPCPGKTEFERLLHVNSLQHPDLHQYLREMRRLVDSYPGDRVLIGETYHLASWQQSLLYHGIGSDECHLPLNFELVRRPWIPGIIREFVNSYDASHPSGAWPNWVLGNHDQHRIATRIGGIIRARLAITMQLTLRGTPICYYGDELGMTDVPVPPEAQKDPYGYRVPDQGRDPERTPMRWNASENAGFSTGIPWLPVGNDYKKVNVETESRDPVSMLTLFRSLAALRQSTPALKLGAYIPINTECQDMFAYLRQHEGDSILVVLNMSEEERKVSIGSEAGPGRVLLSTCLNRYGENVVGCTILRPLEGLILRLVS